MNIFIPAKDFFSQTIAKIRTKPFYASLFFLALSLWTSIILFGSKFYADEKYHYKQIGWFSRGKLEIIPMLTTIPGYHVFISLFTSWLGDLSFLKVRVISFFVSLLAIPLFYVLAKKFPVNEPFRKTLQFIFLPLSFIYFPLIYTDLFSLTLILLAFYLTINNRYNLAAIISIASITVRQNNIVWLLFLWLYSFVSLHGYTLSRKMVIEHLKKTGAFFAGTLAFAMFVWINGSIAIGDKGSHQAGFYMGNIYFFLMLCSILLLPMTLVALLRKETYSKRFFFYGIGIGFLLGLSFFLFPPELHAYNNDPRFLRNILLQLIYHKYSLFYAFAILLGYVSLYLTKLHKYGKIIYPFSCLYLLPSWLVEQRYAIIPIVLLILIRKENNSRNEWTIVLYFLALSLLLVWMIINTKIFF